MLRVLDEISTVESYRPNIVIKQALKYVQAFDP